MTHSGIILASTSRYRRSLLERLGIPFRCLSPLVNEDSFKAARLDPVSLAATLAIAKAESLAKLDPDSVVIGSDQVAALGDEVLGKPGSKKNAVEQLVRLSGQTHRLITAVAVTHLFQTRLHVDVTELRMRPLDRSVLERYVERDDPIDCAGAYKIESQGIALFEAIQSSDQTAIIGLPLIAVVSMLDRCGVAVP
jgi:septum formation protein